MYLNEGTFLNNCRLRYARKQIYTYVANILISINPYEQVPELYSSKMIKKYQGKSLGTLPPHIFAIADKAYRDMRRFKQSQSVIVSGESGAGKTESQKYILRYLCASWGSSSGSIEERILETNPILEAFGNAKTLRNNNSSRFGKFVEIHFDSQYAVAGGYVSHYLLEKSRICLQQGRERNYHIFYQLIAGSDLNLAKKLGLEPLDSFNYLNKGCTQFFSKPSTSQHDLRDELLDDYADFLSLQKALTSIGISTSEMNAIFQTVAAVLHLGNICFEENSDDRTGACMVSENSQRSLQFAANLLGLDPKDLSRGLLFRTMQPTRGGDKGTMIRVPLKSYEAAAARDALAKAIYSRMFDSIVAAINRCIPFGDSVSYIGVLDIAGFEFFTVNSFEQFCINYCNEKLQKFFNDRILKQEQELYAIEYLNVPHIEYTDNQDCIELFEEKVCGLLDMLDEEARLPRPSPKHFTRFFRFLSSIIIYDKLSSGNKNYSPRKSKLREHREILDDEGFLIRHFAGSVCYETNQFLEKNNDALHTSLKILIQQSSVPYICSLFVTNNHQMKMEGRNKVSVSYKFRIQLQELLDRLVNTGTHFVRCIKPNSKMEPGNFEGAQILSQLKCAGMASVLNLMQKGYPSRTTFSDLYNMYKKFLPPELARLDPRLFCKCLFGALGLNSDDYKFGLTKVFFRPGKFAEFDQMLHQDTEHLKQLIHKVQSWLRRVRWRKAQYGVLSCIKLKNKILYRCKALITIQSAVRGYIVRKKEAERSAEANTRQKWMPLVTDLKNQAKTIASHVKVS
ncbi:unnamed protein product [Enterobius vermicularis]|uniref:Myosin motor domain-containing protein n=1 Tax=Enterobius vermicularis TaxID=51028 RepID=A0A0N4VHE1_ENTVE|nr:unnamed protein product [Enterobius vermicularis]